MKLVSLISIALFSMSAKASLHTYEYVLGSKYQLVEYQLAEEHQPRGQITGGKLVIGEKLVELLINVKKVCPPGRFCTMEMPAPIYVKLPIVDIEKTGCGDIIIAKIDDRPVDGILNQLVITDYTHAECKMYVENPVQVEYTTVYYNRIDGVEVEATSQFEFTPAKATFPLQK